MAYLPIYRGATPNDNTGDNLREGARKINSNFAEIYGALGNGSSITFNYNTYKLNEISDVSVPLPLDEQVLAWDTATSMWQAVDKLSGNVVGHMIPTNANNTWDLGSQLYNFRDIYLAGNAIFNPGEQKLYSDNGTLKVQYNYQTSNATLLDTNDSTAATITPGSPSDDVYFSNTSVMDSLTVGGTTVYLFPGIDLSTSAPYGLLPNVTVELTLANASFSNTYTNYDNSVYGQAQAVHADAFYFSGPTSVTVKIGDVSPANTAQMPRQIYNDLLNADSARLEIIRTSSDGIGEVLISNKTQTITNKTIPAANNSILLSIGDLFDVVNSGANTASDGDVLFFRSSSNTWAPAAPGTHPISGAIVNGHLLPTANDTFDLGSPTSQFKDLYLSGNSLHLGSTVISSSGGSVQFSSPLTIKNDLLPDLDSVHNLGSPTKKFHSLFLANSTIHLGDSSLSAGPNGLEFQAVAPKIVYQESDPSPNAQLGNFWATTSANSSYSANNSSLVAWMNADDLDFGGHNFWPTKTLVDNHFELDSRYSATLSFHSVTGAVLGTYDYLPHNSGWFDDGAAVDYFSANPNTRGFFFEAPLGKVVISEPEVAVGGLGAWENLYQTSAFATLTFYDNQGVTPAAPLKPKDDPVGIKSGVPSSSTSTGTKGDMVVDSTHLYVCTDTDTWVRILLTDTSW